MHRAIAISRSSSRLQSGSAMPTTLSTLEVVGQAPLVTGYGPEGFALQGAYVLGSVALLPRGYFHWNVKRAQELNKESFALFHMVVPRIGMLRSHLEAAPIIYSS